jgi:hypothetical protein
MAIGNDATKLFAGVITSLKITTAGFGGLGGDVIAGYTGDDVSLSSTIETQDLTAGQTITPVSTTFKSRKFQLKFSFAEYKLINFAYALGTKAANAGLVSADTYLSGSSDAPDTVCIQVVFANSNEAAAYDVYTLTCFSCKLSSGGTISFTKGTQGFIEVTFDVLDNSGLPYVITKS